MASIKKRGNRFCARVRIGSLSKSKTFRTLAEARRWAFELEQNIISKDGNLSIRAYSDKTLHDLLVAYLGHLELKQKTVKKPTHVSPRKRLKSLISPSSRVNKTPVNETLWALAKKKLSNLETIDFISLRDQYGPNKSIHSDFSILSSAYKLGIKELGWVKVNPIANLSLPPLDSRRSRRLEDDEIQAILEKCEYHEDKPLAHEGSLFAALFLMAIETAARGGELCKIKWEDVDLDKRTCFFRETKNGSDRLIPLSLRAVKIFKQVQKYQCDKGVDRVFAPFGTSAYQATPDKTKYFVAIFYKNLCDSLGIKDLKFHDTRREGLTRMSQKVNVMLLAKISGHRDLKILQQVYYAPNISEVAKLLD